MVKIVWSDAALRHLEEAVNYIQADSPKAALKMQRKLLKAPLKLRPNLRLGGMVPEFERDDVRELLVKPYRVVYRIDGNHVVILGIVHGSRNLKKWVRPDEMV